MSGFSSRQVRALRRKLDRRHVQSRDVEGRTLDYVEGWFAIAETNAIFGFDGWDREMTQFERLFERTRNDRTSCGYLARVRIRVRAGENIVVREGTGWGSATAPMSSEAYERALKAAETDATKRALATFGNRFGLGLYDKEQNGVTPKQPSERSTMLCLYQPEGGVLAENVSPEGFCSGLRQLIGKMQTPVELEALMQANQESLHQLRTEAPNLKTAKGVHYADVLQRVANERVGDLSSNKDEVPLSETAAEGPLKPSKIASGPRIDKSALIIGEERRYRDKEHLKFVASQPCVICERQPAHAHHLTFAQPRGLSIKVSDEFTVALCAVHHDELHRSGGEADWWKNRGLNPIPIASQLWAQSRQRTLGSSLISNRPGGENNALAAGNVREPVGTL
jgi:DNA recombination protein Rad52